MNTNMNVSFGDIYTVGTYMKKNTTRRMAFDVAENQVSRKTEDFEKMLDSTSVSGCSCCSSEDYTSTFDVSI